MQYQNISFGCQILGWMWWCHFYCNFMFVAHPVLDNLDHKYSFFSVNMEKISEKKSIDKIFVKQNT